MCYPPFIPNHREPCLALSFDTKIESFRSSKRDSLWDITSEVWQQLYNADLTVSGSGFGTAFTSLKPRMSPPVSASPLLILQTRATSHRIADENYFSNHPVNVGYSYMLLLTPEESLYICRFSFYVAINGREMF